MPLPFFNPSASLEAERSMYYDHLLRVSQQGDWEGWIDFFARGISEECVRATRRIETLEKLRRSCQKQSRTSGASAILPQLVDELFGHPRLTLEETQKLLKVWPKSVQRLIDRLVELDILRQVTGRKRNRVYLAHQIVDVFSGNSGRATRFDR